MIDKIILTTITFLILGSIWFFTGYWAIEKNKKPLYYVIFLFICAIIGFCLGTILPAIW